MIALKLRQEAGESVEKKMLDFLMQYIPARDLKVGGVHTIATAARTFTFDAVSSMKE